MVKDNLTIGVEVINTHDGTQIWGGQYNRPFADIIDIQQEIVVAYFRYANQNGSSMQSAFLYLKPKMRSPTSTT